MAETTVKLIPISSYEKCEVIPFDTPTDKKLFFKVNEKNGRKTLSWLVPGYKGNERRNIDIDKYLESIGGKFVSEIQIKESMSGLKVWFSSAVSVEPRKS